MHVGATAVRFFKLFIDRIILSREIVGPVVMCCPVKFDDIDLHLRAVLRDGFFQLAQKFQG